MIYFFVFIVCLLFVLLEQVNSESVITTYGSYGLAFFLILFAGTRFYTGPDYGSYMDIYNYPKSLDIEPLFQFLVRLIKSFGASYNVFLLFIAALSIGIKTYAIKKYTPYFFLAIFIALPTSILADMGQIRFSLSISILWLSVPFCIERNTMKFLLIIFIASLTHYTAIIFLPVYLLWNMRINIWYGLGVWALLFFISLKFLNSDSASGLIDLVTKNDALLKYEAYGKNETYFERYNISIMAFASKILVLVFIYYSSIDDERIKRFYYNVIFIGGCLFFFFNFSEIMAARLSIYYASFEALAIPLVIYHTKNIKYHWLLIILFILKTTYQYAGQLIGSDMFNPYRSFLFSN